MELKFTRSKWSTIVWGIVATILGVYLFMNPGTATRTIVTVAGWALTIYGICSLISAFTRLSVILSTADLYIGSLSLLLGILILVWPGFFVAWIFILLGICIIFAGFNSLMASNALRVVGIKGSGVAMVSAVLTIILGFMVVMSPFSMADFTMIMCGIALVYTGITHVIEGIKMPKDVK